MIERRHLTVSSPIFSLKKNKFSLKSTVLYHYIFFVNFLINFFYIFFYFNKKKKEGVRGRSRPSLSFLFDKHIHPQLHLHRDYIVIPERFQLIYIYFMGIETEKHDI
jgi:hypothetical protein